MIPMNNFFRISGIILIIIINFSCKKARPVSSPSILTTTATDVLYATATSGGNVVDDGGGFVTVRGVCWSTTTNPTVENSKTIDGSGLGEFTSSIYGLSLGTFYYMRAYAVNSAGTVYGNEISFTTHVTGVKFNPLLTYGNLNDIDGKSYKTITIGSQVWMAENLSSVKLNDGTPMPQIYDSATWPNLLTPAYCWFDNNDSLYENIWGAYYNWFAVSTGKLCPAGWHVPSDGEWQILVDYLGGSNVAGAKIKEAGKNNWTTSNQDATNDSGFTALPAGLRESFDGIFGGQGIMGGWWSTTELDPSPLSAAWTRWIHADTVILARNNLFKKDGFSVRCVKNSL
jgi:uncharacterized protein (TIGR02145 family)